MSTGAFVQESLIAEIGRLLELCSDKQREFFGRLFPDGLEDLPEDELRNAHALCERTVTKVLDARKSDE